MSFNCEFECITTYVNVVNVVAGDLLVLLIGEACEVCSTIVCTIDMRNGEYIIVTQVVIAPA
jgi:hypothetical protein